MHPVQHFRANFAQPDRADAVTATLTDNAIDRTERHDTDSAVRNVCFVWEDGRRVFFNYAYLLSVDLVLSEDLNVMLLYFSGQIVTLKGYRLVMLFDLLLNHIPKTITASNPRYVHNSQTSAVLVTEIAVKSE